MAVAVAACGNGNEKTIGGADGPTGIVVTDSTAPESGAAASTDAAAGKTDGAADGTSAGTAGTEAAGEEASGAATTETAADSAADASPDLEARAKEVEGYLEELQYNEQNTKLRLSVEEENEREPESGDALMTAKLQKFDVEDNGYDALEDALEREGDEQEQFIEEDFANNLEVAREQAQDENASAALPYVTESTVQVKRADDTILSYTRTNYSYYGGAHPNTYYNGRNFDPKTGKELTLREVALDYDELYQYVLDALKARQEKEVSDGDGSIFFDDYETTVHDLFYGADGTGDFVVVQWFMTEKALYVVFNAYDIAPYAAGPSTVEIPFALLQASYFPQP